MLDYTQVLIIAAITIMTVILTIIGVQIIFILKDVRNVLDRLNRIADALEAFGMNVQSGTAEIIGFVSGVRKVMTMVEHFADDSKSSKKKKK